ncbi:hypothetical protein K443DRAFT_675411 [Laccaria amethystina LaAM-08-1]|uniref:Uncharacterized protein n=1 Tax=Laccaria amethystina LaAM-08-1 TaxID=1095629 RepID=A0A0C9XTX3_9AGAR|nr:hypothetical protein K443DRAFT_675411 [Laccaria amethystina LaAM-08-1]
MSEGAKSILQVGFYGATNPHFSPMWNCSALSPLLSWKEDQPKTIRGPCSEARRVDDLCFENRSWRVPNCLSRLPFYSIYFCCSEDMTASCRISTERGEFLNYSSKHHG